MSERNFKFNNQLESLVEIACKNKQLNDKKTINFRKMSRNRISISKIQDERLQQKKRQRSKKTDFSRRATAFLEQLNNSIKRSKVSWVGLGVESNSETGLPACVPLSIRLLAQLDRHCFDTFAF